MLEKKINRVLWDKDAVIRKNIYHEHRDMNILYPKYDQNRQITRILKSMSML